MDRKWTAIDLQAHGACALRFLYNKFRCNVNTYLFYLNKKVFQKFVSKVKTNNAQITDKKIIEEGLKLHYDADLFFLSTNFVSLLHYNMVSLIFKKANRY